MIPSCSVIRILNVRLIVCYSYALCKSSAVDKQFLILQVWHRNNHMYLSQEVIKKIVRLMHNRINAVCEKFVFWKRKLT